MFWQRQVGDDKVTKDRKHSRWQVKVNSHDQTGRKIDWGNEESNGESNGEWMPKAEKECQQIWGNGDDGVSLLQFHNSDRNGDEKQVSLSIQSKIMITRTKLS